MILLNPSQGPLTGILPGVTENLPGFLLRRCFLKKLLDLLKLFDLSIP